MQRNVQGDFMPKGSFWMISLEKNLAWRREAGPSDIVSSQVFWLFHESVPSSGSFRNSFPLTGHWPAQTGAASHVWNVCLSSEFKESEHFLNTFQILGSVVWGLYLFRQCSHKICYVVLLSLFYKHGNQGSEILNSFPTVQAQSTCTPGMWVCTKRIVLCTSNIWCY